MRKQLACPAKRTGVANRVPTIYGSEPRQEGPSVNASSSFAAPQPFATRLEDAVGNRARISVIAVPAPLESPRTVWKPQGDSKL